MWGQCSGDLQHHMNKGRGSTFNGCILEFPGVAADKFNCNASIFLLSHHHADHTIGLRNRTFNRRVYCSKGTKKLLESNKSYNHIQHLIRALDYNRQYTLNVEQDKEITLVVVTLIPSYHCPGSCMFLIEQDEKAVIYTGDIRAEDWWIKGLPYNQFLYPYTSSKQLENIYIDTTFAYRGEPYAKYATNSDALKMLAGILALYPKDDPEIQFYFNDSVSGLDECWIKLAYEFGLEIHAEATNSKILNVVEVTETLPSYGGRHTFTHTIEGTKAPQKSKLHACGRYWKCTEPKAKFPVSICQYSDFNVVDFAAASMPIRIDSIHGVDIEGLKKIDTTAKGNKIYNFKNRVWLLSQDGTELLPDNLKLLFSRHSSYEETVNFISIFKPKQVFPCCESRQTWLNGFTVKRIFGSVCSPGMESSYDQMMEREHGMPLSQITDREVKQVNRWSVAECEQERKFVAGFYSKLDQNPGNGKLLALEYAKDYRTNTYTGEVAKDAKNYDYKVQDLVAGRREKWYSNFIENCQNEYFEMLQYGELSGSKKDVHSSSIFMPSSSDNDLIPSSAVKESMRNLSELLNMKKRQPYLVRKPNCRNLDMRTRSMVFSSFDSFEMSFAENTTTNNNGNQVLFRSGNKFDAESVASINAKLRGNPDLWSLTPLTKLTLKP